MKKIKKNQKKPKYSVANGHVRVKVTRVAGVMLSSVGAPHAEFLEHARLVGAVACDHAANGMGVQIKIEALTPRYK